MENLVGVLGHWLALGAESIATVIVGISGLIAGVKSLICLFSPSQSKRSEGIVGIRLEFSHWLTVALEFLIAADILQTAVAPNWNEIGQLAAVIALRTVLVFFLQKEIYQTKSL